MNPSRRTMVVLIFGFLAGAMAFCAYYFAATSAQREMLASQTPELIWLKQEFGLSDTEFMRIRELHEGYLPECRELCRELAQINDNLRKELASSTAVTPAVRTLLDDRARLVAECQAGMLKHFFEVSRAMPAEQGKRYLTWVQEATCLRDSMTASSGHGHEAGRMQ